jgi:hypothetical protein
LGKTKEVPIFFKSWHITKTHNSIVSQRVLCVKIKD